MHPDKLGDLREAIKRSPKARELARIWIESLSGGESG